MSDAPERPTPAERMLVNSWTDDEWLSVLDHLPPDADISEAIEHVQRLRDAARGSV